MGELQSRVEKLRQIAEEQGPRWIGKITYCSSCRARIIWTLTANDHRMPIDADPVENGNVVITGWIGPIPKTRVARVDEQLDAQPRYLSHFATCPNASDFR